MPDDDTALAINTYAKDIILNEKPYIECIKGLYVQWKTSCLEDVIY